MSEFENSGVLKGKKTTCQTNYVQPRHEMSDNTLKDLPLNQRFL